MQQRPIIYTLEQIRSFDALSGYVDALIGDANGLQVVLGATGTVISNLVVTPENPASLTLNISNGFIAQLESVDQSAYGSLAATTQQVLQLGANIVTSVAISNAGLSAGQAQYVMLEAGFKQQDAIATNDPNGGVLPYVNISNPADPFYGPGNSGVAQNTVRNAVCDIKVIYGTPATAGSEVPPTPDAGYVPVALIDLAHGQVSITGGEILNPNLVGGSAPSPILAGLLNAHHGGIPGQAPQIHLAAGPNQEVQGELPTANMVASNSIGAVSTMRECAGNPNGQLSGNANTNGAPDFAYDVTNLLLYVCSTTGDSTHAVWTSVAAPLPNNLLYFGTGVAQNLRPLPTSGSASGEYYTSGAWTQTGALSLSNCRLFFGGTVTFNAAVTVATEMPGGAAGNGDATTPGFAGNGSGLGAGGGSQESGGGGGGGHGGGGGFGGTDGPSAGSFPGVGGGTYPLASLLTGSGGGGGSEAAATQCPGGAGGGALYIESVGSVTFASGTTLAANGATGGGGTLNEQSGGGGGSGGGIQVRSMNNVIVAAGATLSANGGDGGHSTGAAGTYGGGSGGGGIVDLSGTVVTNNGTITVAAGTAGTGVDGNGQNGSVGIINLNSVALSRRAPN